jgi:hypothetical protein
MELTYTNGGGEILTIRQARPFFLTKIDGTGRVRQSVNTFQAPEQDGAFFISSSLDMRNITIEGSVLANTPDEAYDLRAQLLRQFTPKQQGVLTFRGKQIPCVVEEAALTASSRERAPNFFISLLCPSPFFETPDEERVELAAWEPQFHFLLEIPAAGIEFGSRQPSQIITVDNIGDVACGCRIVFKALGTVSNPEILNVDTGAYIRIVKTMTAGEEIRVYTHFAGKRITNLAGLTETSAFHLLDTGSVFLQLAAGRNVLRYDAAVNMDLLEVSIFFRPLFLGV